MPRTYNLAGGGLRIVLTRTEAEAVARGDKKFVLQAVAPAPEPKVRTFATKAERKAGLGFPCTAATPCSRADLRTPEGAARHATTQLEMAAGGCHAADRQPLPKV